MVPGCLVLCVALLLLLAMVEAGLPHTERTLAMVKPDGVGGNHTDTIKSIIRTSGFVITREASLHLDVKTAELFYSEHSEKPFFGELIDFMTSGPAVAMVLEQENAVTNWRKLIGPTDPNNARNEQPSSIRAMCGSSTTKNCVHGSDSPIAAAREISILFEDIQKDMIRHDEL